MSDYRISGVWKNTQGVITHYAMHQKAAADTHTRAIKTTKADAITLVETIGNTVHTWMWDYIQAGWSLGEKVIVVERGGVKFLRTNRDSQLSDNLSNLIDYDWIAP